MNRKFFFAIAVLAASISFRADAQVNINIGIQPVWGPVGYDHVDYYYMPDIDAYYDVPNRVYEYNDGGRWISSSSLPPQYSGFDLYNAHKVVINEPQPWMNNDRYRQQYAQFRGRHDQHPIRDSHEQKYWQNPAHPEHSKWNGNPGSGKGHTGSVRQVRTNGNHAGGHQAPAGNGNQGNNPHGNNNGHDNGRH